MRPNRLKLLLEQPGYNPNHLIDVLIERLKLKNDAALACVLDVQPPVISKIRHCRLPVSGDMLIRMYDANDGELSINDLRSLMGVQLEALR